ncbi:MAG: discoidin domain-containing protein [Candidatus Spyradosoma sp.]
MKLFTGFLVAAAVFCASAEAPHAFAAGEKTAVAAGSRSVDYAKTLADLEAKIRKISAGKSWRELEKNAEFRRLALAADAIRTAGADNVSALAARDAKYAAFLKVFLADPEWMLRYAGAGLVPAGTDVGLRVMGDIWKAHGADADFRAYLSLTCGLGAAWGAGGFAQVLQEGERVKTNLGRRDPVWRYEFFVKSRKAGRLHKNFMNLRPWEIRFVAGTKWDDASLAYTQKRINLPPERYGEACWAATYAGTSEFGDTVQGPLYYTAWPDTMGDAERTVRHGGVCGALSHVGMTAAAAHGIPSYPCGQPGHCAYAFRLERGKWRGGFGGPDGGPHNYIFPGEAPTATNLMEAAFADDAKTDAAYAARAGALALDAAENVDAAREAWNAALDATPHNFYLQREFQDFARARRLFDADGWKQYAEGILKKYDGHGFAAERLVEPLEKEFFGAATPEEKIAWFAKVHACIAGTPTSWATKLVPVVERETKKLGGDARVQERFLRMLLTTHLARGNGENFGQALEWAVKQYVASGKGEIFAGAFADAAGVSAGGNSGGGKLRDAFGKAILAAEAARSPEAVRSISAMAEKAGFGKGYDGPAKLDEPPGKLVSDSGYLRTSSTSSWDNPCAHANVLRPAAGAFHTAQEESAFAVVELPRAVSLSGILIVKNCGNEHRSRRMKIYRSTDGATWFLVASSTNTPSQWKLVFDEPLSARFVKVECAAEGKEWFHLRNILIYEK